MTTHPGRDSYHHGDLRNALIEEALRLIARRGVEAFSLREAARALGVSPTAAYRHFADKGSLLGAVASEGFARLATAMERAVARLEAPAGSPAHAMAALGAVGEAYVEFALRHPSHFRVMFGPWMRETAGCQPGLSPSGKSAYQLLTDALDALVTSGAVTPEARAGAEIAAWAAVHGFASLALDGTLDLAPRERTAALRLVQRTLLLGLGIDPGLVERADPVDTRPSKMRCPT